VGSIPIARSKIPEMQTDIRQNAIVPQTLANLRHGGLKRIGFVNNIFF
jgi:hypothetical protein